ncbi:unnamed protein product [Notodromas monacha]|uniref:Endoplasmic reticulum-Golgi intermediate compartment protein 2 n=1 Tax=Notodromas monacha TaxID=399045 RepID=A0A7R9G9B5_9CRUS|nr:unnamed protein product [Notodromas monacha]CAG0912679.1 unnamed protein product [Notodromas monacha]
MSNILTELCIGFVRVGEGELLRNMLRNRKKPLAKVFKELDAFTKVPEEYTETSRSGGTVSIITFAVMLWFVASEVWQFLYDSEIKFKFVPDDDVSDAKMTINLDITVATPCRFIGADVLDISKNTIPTFGSLEEEDTWFEMTRLQEEHFENMRHVNLYLRQDYHSLAEVLFKSRFQQMFGGIPKRSKNEIPNHPPDACRFHGSLSVNKIDGNLHIIQGKVLPIAHGHAHIGMMGPMNFSHRINHFSFGEPAIGIINPLDGDERIAQIDMINYQYFIKIVPTEMMGRYLGGTSTFQYSVTEQEREIDHSKGSHGMAGIFFKYELSSVKVQIFEESESLVRFCVRLCAVVGGIYATSGKFKNIPEGVLYGIVNSFLFLASKRGVPMAPGDRVDEPSYSLLGSHDLTLSTNLLEGSMNGT